MLVSPTHPEKIAKDLPVKPLRHIALAVMLPGLLAVGCAKPSAPGPSDTGEATVAPKPAAAAPPKEVTVRVLDYEGIRMLVESQRGKVVVVDYWATDCPPCLKEFPGLVDLDRQYADQGVVCVSVSLDYIGLPNKPAADYIPQVKPFLEKFGATFDNVLAGDDVDTMLEKLKLGSPPAVYVYAQDGTLAKRFDNSSVSSEEDAFTYADVESLVVELLAANHR
ncbi:Thiol-disulfide oxidoreductase ResA [Blastopirellula retiformator]|uniref:Thiol-disulfide oxidoreductase ResA n=1 Tax=Blastopirellula retiformator TaxID=2527970 RepID=A0A5C5UWR4_9BACT|nr:Thiol-disulfide oxidoreductase ResA [Blastopirellula retiformator]